MRGGGLLGEEQGVGRGRERRIEAGAVAIQQRQPFCGRGDPAWQLTWRGGHL